MLFRRIALLALAALLSAPAALHGQDLPLAIEMPLPAGLRYDPAIPTPQDVLGHLIGEKHTPPHEVVEYFRAVAAASPRVTLHEHGRTYEGRPLIHAIVTSPGNHARLEPIRQQHLRLTDAPATVSDAELEAMPAVAYMGYSIHGNEASGTEAALLLLYHLAAGQGPSVDDILDDVVTLVDPLFNPDGRDRFADWVNRNRGAVATADDQDREHNEPWPGGRTNHYWFDLNRDWMPAQHPESQARLEVFHRWRPQVLTDYHEMGGDATYFFQPGIPSRNNPNTPARTFELTAEIAQYNARALDALGSLYYTRESFDDFYYGKGSTYPDVQGAVGILFEQASSRALQSETDNGLLTYAFTARNQFAASLGTLEAVTRMRTALLRHTRDFYAEADDVARAFPVKAYVLSLERDRTRVQALARLLQRHRVEIHDLAAAVEIDGTTYRPGAAYIVPVDQPQARFVKAVMEPVLSFQDSLFYDVSAWSLGMAFDVDYGELRRDAGPFVGNEVGPVVFDGGALVGAPARYAYLMEWGRYYAPRALYRMQRAGVRARLLTEETATMVGGERRTFERGTILIPLVQPDVAPEEIHALVREAVEEDHVRIYGVSTGLTPEGPDLGGRGVEVLERPRVALVTGAGASSYNAGEVWHLLSERFRMPVSLVDADDLGRADLSRYNTIVMAGGGYGALADEAVVDWVRSGGTLITLTSATGWAVRQDLIDLERKELDLDSLYQDLPYDQVSTARGAQVVGGAIFEARLDTTHPVAYGFERTIPLFRRSSQFYAPSERPGTNVAVYTQAPLLSGYLSEEVAEVAGGSAAITAARAGAGRIVAFQDNPNFRAFWYGSNGLFLNAVFFGGVF